ncbi:MAG: carboxypeptidase-like regulatory domain-containing protein, partial [Planctomycetota bacterium]
RLQSRYSSNHDGDNRVVGLPGPAIVALGGANPQYLNGIGADRIAGLNEEGRYATFANPTQANLGALALAEINPSAVEREVRVDLQLERGKQRKLQVVDPEGKPVINASVSGLTPRANYSPQDHFLPLMTVVALAPGEQRTVLVQHHRRGLAARTEIDAARSEMEVVKLRKAATISGRLVDVNGAVVRARIEAVTTLKRNQVRLDESPTDKTGTFQLTGLPDGVPLQLRLQGANGRLPAPAREVTTVAGKAIDLGTLIVR